MENKDENLWFLVFVMAIGAIDAHVSGNNIFVGMMFGVILSTIGSIFGILPIIGQIGYYIVGTALLRYAGMWLPLSFWVGMMYSILVSAMILIAFLWDGETKLFINLP